MARTGWCGPFELALDLDGGRGQFSRMHYLIRKFPLFVFVSLPGVAILSLLLIGGGCAGHQPAGMKTALAAAKTNRPELQKAIRHYQALGDPQKLAAAYFLITNMDGHGQVIWGLYDKQQHEIPYNALDYPGFGEAQAALDKLEKQHGELEMKQKRFIPDLETVTADYLIENIDLAFEAWRAKPWAKGLTFQAFLENILPYRGNKEPVEPWRAACMRRYQDIPAKLKNPADFREAAGFVMNDVNGWVGFNELYYLHPTDQGFAEMEAGRRGRCGDIANMTSYALRANAIPFGSDYTPFWADRDNNHAWTVILDEKGEGRAGLSNRAAKIYRKTYALQFQNLAFQ